MMLRNIRQFLRTNNECILRNSKLASTYEGDGKTTALVLNKEMDFIMIDRYSSVGFCLNNGMRLIGPSVIFPRTVFSWNISGVEAVNEQSLSLFKILNPKLDIIIFGYGDANCLPAEVNQRVRDFSKKFRTGFEVLPTDKAVSTFNYLVNEKRLVAAALIPPKIVKIYDDNDYAHAQQRQQILLAE